MTRGAYRTAQPIEQSTRRLVDDRGWQIGETRIDDITCERSRDSERRDRLHAGDLLGERGRRVFHVQLIVMLARLTTSANSFTWLLM